MAIRLSIYDFFSHTVPGTLALLLTGLWLVVADVDVVTSSVPSNSTRIPWSASPLLIVLMFIVVAYVMGLLATPLSYRWFTLFVPRNRDAAKSAFDEVRMRYPWLGEMFKSQDWSVLLFSMKYESVDVAMDVELHNVTSIMLRNISLVLFVNTLACLAYYGAISADPWCLVIAVVSVALSFMAVSQSAVRRKWFFTGIFEAYVAQSEFQRRSANSRLASATGPDSNETKITRASRSKRNPEPGVVSKP